MHCKSAFASPGVLCNDRSERKKTGYVSVSKSDGIRLYADGVMMEATWSYFSMHVGPGLSGPVGYNRSSGRFAAVRPEPSELCDCCVIERRSSGRISACDAGVALRNRAGGGRWDRMRVSGTDGGLRRAQGPGRACDAAGVATHPRCVRAGIEGG